MVGSVLILLLCLPLGVGGESVYEQIYLDHKIDASPQIHYRHCDRKYSCLVPSKYFNRAQEKSLYISKRTDTPYHDGIEIHAVSSSEWHMTLMANSSSSAVEFTWAGTTFLKCDNKTKKGDVLYTSPYSTVTARDDRLLTFKDRRMGGNETNAMICTFKLQRRSNVTDRSMTTIFAALVHATRKKQMCLKITGPVVNETFCNFIEDLQPNLLISLNPLLCTNCAANEDICKMGDNIAEAMKKCQKTFELKLSYMKTREHTGCEYFYSARKMLVNNQFYAKEGSEIICHQDRWVMLRYDPQPSQENPYEIREHFVEKIDSIIEDTVFDCRYSSPLKSMCQQGTTCVRIKDWEAPLRCDDEFVLTYYGKVKKAKFALSEATCNEAGVWIGVDLVQPKRTYTLRAGDNIVCENPDEEPFEDDEIDLDSDAVRQGELLRRDEAKNYTSLIVIGTVVAVMTIIIIIIIGIVVSSCVGPLKKQPIGLPKSERSQRPLSAAGDEEMSFSDRVSLMLT